MYSLVGIRGAGFFAAFNIELLSYIDREGQFCYHHTFRSYKQKLHEGGQKMSSLEFIFLYHILDIEGKIVDHRLVPVSIPRNGDNAEGIVKIMDKADEIVRGKIWIWQKAVLVQIIQLPHREE